MATVQTIAALRRALREKTRQMTALKAKRAAAAKTLRKAASAAKKASAAQAKAKANLKALDDEMSTLAGTAAPPKPAKKKVARKKVARKKVARKKAARKKTAAKKPAAAKRSAPAGGLAGVLVTVLTGKAGVSVPDATKLVLATGYTTRSKQFQTIVNQTLLRDPRFVKVSRGVYALKGQAAGAKAPQKPAAKKKTKKRVAKTKAPKPATKAPAKKAKRAKKASQPGSLKAILKGFLKGKAAVGIREATDAVLATGYTSKARNFRLIVNQMLAKDTAFKQVGRGKYALK